MLGNHPRRALPAVLFLLTLFFLVFLHPFHVSAADDASQPASQSTATTADMQSQIIGDTGADAVLRDVPPEASDYIDSAGGALDITTLSRSLDPGFLLGGVLKLIGAAAPGIASSCLPLFGMLLLCGAAYALKHSVGGGGLLQALDFVTIACLAAFTFNITAGCFTQSVGYITQLRDYMNTMLPVMSTLYAAGGNVTAAAVNSSVLTVICSVVGSLCDRVLVPLMQAGFALALAGSVVGAVNFNSISALVKKLVTWIMVASMTLLGAVLVFQNALAGAADSVAARTVKFALASFIPVVGGVIGDATGAVMGSLDAVKSIVGVFGVLVVIFTVLPPLIYIGMSKLMFKAAVAVAQLLGLEREAGFIGEMDSLLGYLMGVMACVAAVFIFALALFIKTAAAFYSN